MSSQPETVQEVLARYREAYDEREATIGSFLDDNGDLKKGASLVEYDAASAEAWSDSHSDLGSLLSELEETLGLRLAVGDRVIVEEDAESASGGAVYFGGEITGAVTAGINDDGDIQVTSTGGILQYVAPHFVKPIEG